MYKNRYRLLIVLSISLLSIPAFALSALDPWNAETREALALPVKVWLGLMLINNLASLFFLRRFKAPRWVFGGWFVSHGTGLILMLLGFEFVVGQVSILHIICWTPGGIALFLLRDDIRTGSTAYRVWAILACLFYLGSMAFDVPDALTYLMS